MYLPRPNGTRDVFCEMAYRKRRPCTRYATFTANGAILSGYSVYDRSDNVATFVCSAKCLEAYAKGKRTC